MGLNGVVVILMTIWLEALCMAVVSPAEAAFMPFSEGATVMNNYAKEQNLSMSQVRGHGVVNGSEVNHVRRDFFFNPLPDLTCTQDGSRNQGVPSIYFQNRTEIVLDVFQSDMGALYDCRGFTKIGDFVGNGWIKIFRYVKFANAEHKDIGAFNQCDGFFCNISGFLSGVSRFTRNVQRFLSFSSLAFAGDGGFSDKTSSLDNQSVCSESENPSQNHQAPIAKRFIGFFILGQLGFWIGGRGVDSRRRLWEHFGCFLWMLGAIYLMTLGFPSTWGWWL